MATNESSLQYSLVLGEVASQTNHLTCSPPPVNHSTCPNIPAIILQPNKYHIICRTTEPRSCSGIKFVVVVDSDDSDDPDSKMMEKIPPIPKYLNSDHSTKQNISNNTTTDAPDLMIPPTETPSSIQPTINVPNVPMVVPVVNAGLSTPAVPAPALASQMSTDVNALTAVPITSTPASTIPPPIVSQNNKGGKYYLVTVGQRTGVFQNWYIALQSFEAHLIQQ